MPTVDHSFRLCDSLSFSGSAILNLCSASLKPLNPQNKYQGHAVSVLKGCYDPDKEKYSKIAMFALI